MKTPQLSDKIVGFEKYYNNTFQTVTCLHCDGTGDDPEEDQDEDYSYGCSPYPCPSCEGLGKIILKDFRLIKFMFSSHKN